jgi:hypothetical protein
LRTPSAGALFSGTFGILLINKDIIETAMAKSPQKRYSSVIEIENIINNVIHR